MLSRWLGESEEWLIKEYEPIRRYKQKQKEQKQKEGNE